MFETHHPSTAASHDHSATGNAIGDADDASYLFASSGELLGDAFVTADDDAAASGIAVDFALKGAGRQGEAGPSSFTHFDHLGGLYDQYNESGPSSIQFGDSNEASERGESHLSHKDEIDVSANAVNGWHVDGLDGEKVRVDDQPVLAQGILENGSHDGCLAEPGKVAKRAAVNDEPVPKSSPRLPLFDSADDAIQEALDNQLKSFQIPDASGKASKMPRIKQSPTHTPRGRPPKKVVPEFRAKSSIPANLSPEEFAHECILAAISSRLNPFALHKGEHKLLREHVTHAQVTNYLNIRNGILRLWTRNALVSVSRAEAAGCAKETRYIAMALVAHQWLIRHGYINHGCVEVSSSVGPVPRMLSKRRRRRTIVVVGAGMSGLGCARQLEALFTQFGEQWTRDAEKPPKVVVLEGRNRIGGRIYSHPLREQAASGLPDGLRSTADMGAQIVTGFENGNPLNAIIRGQLGLRCHALRDNSVLYDCDGKMVEKSTDIRVEKLYNDILERAAVFRNKPPSVDQVEGNRELMERGKDSSGEADATIAVLEDSGLPVTIPRKPRPGPKGAPENGPALSEKLAVRAYQTTGSSSVPAAQSAAGMGWQLKPAVFMSESIDLEPLAQSLVHPTLGETMDDGIMQFQELLDFTTLDMRLLNWHHANLEYANAVNVNQLSLGGWDQDIGNEFEGSHCTIVGGYQQVPRGLYLHPSQLDVRFQKEIKKVTYTHEAVDEEPSASVECVDGEVIAADRVVMTASLGVLKAGTLQFDPPLPDWKQGAIDRLGFGLLNKIVLVYEKPFWEENRDMFGLLNSGLPRTSLETRDYSDNRGRFYLFWNCITTSGRAMLVALMAGHAAHSVEFTPEAALIAEATGRLSQIFAPATVPQPSEAIVTRWRRDPFARGSYSYVGPTAQPGDYDAMAKPVGPIHFAGEATCGTHPATVHGAYLSGLRAAADIVESLIGPIPVPTPLVPPRQRTSTAADSSSAVSPTKRALNTDAPGPSPHAALPTGPSALLDPPASSHTPTTTAGPSRDSHRALLAAATAATESRLGPRPAKPARTTANPFLFYTRDHWGRVKAACAATGRAGRTEVRNALGRAWREAGAEERAPYLAEAAVVKERARRADEAWRRGVEEWEREAERVRGELEVGVRVGEGRGEGEMEVEVQRGNDGLEAELPNDGLKGEGTMEVDRVNNGLETEQSNDGLEAEHPNDELDAVQPNDDMEAEQLNDGLEDEVVVGVAPDTTAGLEERSRKKPRLNMPVALSSGEGLA